MIQNVIMVICGRKGSGKSEFLKRQIYPHLRRMVVIDSQNEYGGGGETSTRAETSTLNTGLSDLLTGATVVRSMAEFRQAYCEQYGYQGFRIVTKFRDDDPEQVFEIISKTGYCSIIVEEVDLYDSPTGSRTSDFSDIVKRARHKKVNLFCTTQRPAEISRKLTSQSDILITFKQDEYLDLQYFSRWLGKDVDCLKNLEIGQYKTVKGQETLDALLKHYSKGVNNGRKKR